MPKTGTRKHLLLTQELRKKLPPLYSQESKDASEVQVVVKFFSPYTGWRWYATEFDGEDTFFGYVEGFEKELGTFSLSELENARVFGRVPAVERDCYYTPQTLAEVMAQ